MNFDHPLRLLLLTPLWSHDGAGPSGIANHFHTLAHALVRSGHEVVVCWVVDPLHFDQPEPTATLPPGLRVVRVDVRTRLLAGREWHARRLAWQLLALPAALRAVAALHLATPFHAIETTSFLSLGLLIEQTPGLPPVFTRVSTTLDQLATRHTGIYSRALRLSAELENLCIRRARHPLTHTRRHRDELVGLLGLAPRRVALVPHGVAAAPHVSPAAIAGRPALLFVGNTGPRKGLDVLLDAAPAVFAALPDAALHFAGVTDDEPDLSARLDALAARHPGRVFRHGVVSATTRENLYAACDVLLMPSRYESFGLPLVEAMRYGKPVVATTAGGMPEVVGDAAGLLAAPGDPASFAAAVVALCADPAKLARHGAAARERYARLFTAEALAASSASLYRSLLRHATGLAP